MKNARHNLYLNDSTTRNHTHISKRELAEPSNPIEGFDERTAHEFRSTNAAVRTRDKYLTRHGNPFRRYAVEVELSFQLKRKEI